MHASEVATDELQERIRIYDEEINNPLDGIKIAAEGYTSGSERLFTSTQSSRCLFQLALGIWADRIGLSRADYTGLLEVAALAVPGDWKKLPDTLDALHKQYSRSIPTPPIYSKVIPVCADKQPTGVKPTNESPVYFINALQLINTMLNCPQLRNKMHFGMAELVDEPSELWHSGSWAESIRSCSGEFARYPNGRPIFPSDTVRHANGLGRVKEVFKDKRTIGNENNAIILVLQNILSYSALTSEMDDLVNMVHPNESFLIEDDIEYLPAQYVYEQIDITHYDPLQAWEQPDFQGIWVTRIINKAKKTIRPFRLSHAIRAEIEIDVYGRQHLEDTLAGSSLPIFSIPQLTFIDAFGVYRNMYRTLTGIYMIPSNLPVRERTRLENVFPITLGPHGSSLEDVLKCLEPVSKALEGGVEMAINITHGIAKKVHVTSFALGYLGDTPQQNENAGFLRSNANFGCRTCLIPSKSYSNLDFDSVKHGRYHYEVQNIRKKALALSKSAQNEYYQKLGMRPEGSYILRTLSPSLDNIRGHPPDPPHACCFGIARMMQNLLINYILLSNELSEYSMRFQSLPLPAGWARIQNPIKHRKSWDLSETARAIVVTAMVLRSWLEDSKINHQVAGVIKNEFPASGIDNDASAYIIKSFCKMAYAYGQVSWQKASIQARKAMAAAVIESRKTFVQLVGLIVKARTTGNRRGRTASVVSTTGPIDEAIQEHAWELVGEDATVAAGERYNENMNTKIPASKLARWADRSNVHVATHYEAHSEYYATMWNTFVLIGECYHRLFKAWVLLTNNRNIELQLLKRDVRYKTIRFIIGGAYSISHPWISEQLTLLLEHCPTIMEQFLPPSLHHFLDLSEQEEELAGTEHHILPRVRNSVAGKELEDFSLPKRAIEELVWFMPALKLAYSRYYGKANAQELYHPLRYWRKFTFIDKASEKRLSFTCGSYVLFNDYDCIRQYGAIDHIFTHKYGELERIFVILKTLRLLNLQDSLAAIPLLELTNQREIIGLPAILPNRPYILKTRGRFVNLEVEPSEDIHWLCDWDINYG
ncbi:hypothetical protein EDC01DRAFT_623375 [Geopyxis carbonaria]|nr:hypothetical protein EDC01DRAFT_623375 [Geopyxis carbonaria]